MSPKLMIAACLVLALVPFWIASVVSNFTWKGAAFGAAIITAAGVCFVIGGFELSIIAVGIGYGTIVFWAMARMISARLARARLLENSRPERSDLERWARKALRRQGWSVEVKVPPLRLIARKKGCTEFHAFCATDCTTLGSAEGRVLQQYALRTSAPVILLLFGGAPPVLVASLRSQKILPVSQKHFLSHLEQATSRNAFVASCRTAVIEEAGVGLSAYSNALQGAAC